MFVASSAGEILFNKEEADILLHRPVPSKILLWSKIRVLVEVSLWISAAINLAAFICGTTMSDGGWLFPLAHALAVTGEALFCAGGVVLVYQLCLRWFGRERLEGLMTTAQMMLAIVAVVGGQIVPRVMMQLNGVVTFSAKSWWVALLPPAWFAGVDDAIAGSRAASSWALAGLALAATAMVLWLAFGKLAASYEVGLQAMGEMVAAPRRGSRGGVRLLDKLSHLPPLNWFLRQPVARAGFLLTTAYLARDRDVKLRVYPGLAPMLVMPFIFLLQPHGVREAGFGHFGIAFASAYVGILPMVGLSWLQYSQQWQASDIFRVAPIAGPKLLCDGARVAVMAFLTVPMLLVFAGICVALHGFNADLLLLLPGIVSLPIYALVPSLIGTGVPLSRPTEEAKSASRGLIMMPVMFSSMGIAGLATVAEKFGFFWWFLLGEIVIVGIAYAAMRSGTARTRWKPID